MTLKCKGLLEGSWTAPEDSDQLGVTALDLRLRSDRVCRYQLGSFPVAARNDTVLAVLLRVHVTCPDGEDLSLGEPGRIRGHTAQYVHSVCRTDLNLPRVALGGRRAARDTRQREVPLLGQNVRNSFTEPAALHGALHLHREGVEGPRHHVLALVGGVVLPSFDNIAGPACRQHDS